VIAAASLLLGLIGNLLFYGSPIGINVFLYGSLFSIAAFTLLFCFQRPVIAKHAVFIIPALSFALLLGVRLAPQLILFNTMMMLGSLVIVVHFVGVRHFLGEHWSNLLRRTVETIAFGWLKSLQDVAPDSLRWFGQTELDNQQLANVKSALRGLLITLPVVSFYPAAEFRRCRFQRSGRADYLTFFTGERSQCHRTNAPGGNPYARFPDSVLDDAQPVIRCTLFSYSPPSAENAAFSPEHH
jgi:hypothetical protein